MAITDSIAVIDADTHVLEPPDLWTSRMSTAKWGDRVPRLVWSDEQNVDLWLSGDKVVGWGPAWAAHAGSDEWYPYQSKSWDDAAKATPAAFDPKERLRLMDDYGVHAQLLYPNVLMFGGGMFLKADSDDANLILECTRAYNDFLTDYATIAPDRFIAIAALPFWDVDASIAEMHRAKEMGHRGVIFPQFPEFQGLPRLSDKHWDRLWGAAQEAEMSINFHIGSGGASDPEPFIVDEVGRGANAPQATMVFFIDNARTIASLTCGGICHRFPKLVAVSVESGATWVPFVLQALDYAWQNSAARKEHPEYLLPSEYFRRQLKACFFFEHGAPLDAAIEYLGEDSLFYETDYPHPMSMAPGPTTMSVTPKEYIETTLSHLPRPTLQKLLHDNAASVYHLD
jgi:predicted TIM-barrel fold metal-dependent hydrolase